MNRPTKLKLPFIPLLILTMAFAWSCSKKQNNDNGKKDKPSATVDVMVASQHEFSADVQVNGTVLSDEMIELHPEVNGRLTYLNIPDGAFVKKGTVLARINDADLQAQLLQQKVQLELAQKTEQRLRQLLKVNGIDQSSYDAALSQVNLYEANIEVINAQLDKTVIKAAFDGRLGLRLVSQGAYVTQSTAIGTLQKTDRLKIDFAVPEVYADLVKPGKKVMVQPATSDKKIEATISALEPQVNTATRNLTARAYVTSPAFSPGAFVKVWLSDESKGILVPTNSIIPDAIASQVVLVKDGTAKMQYVETGIRTADNVEITSGINEGDTVVVSGVLYVRPNAPVKVRKVLEMGSKQPTH